VKSAASPVGFACSFRFTVLAIRPAVRAPSSKPSFCLKTVSARRRSERVRTSAIWINNVTYP